MKTLLKNGDIINVFTEQVEKVDILIEDGKIISVGNYLTENDADRVDDLNGKIICPGFIDGHVHIESTMLTPYELSKICLLHGTTSIVADPHEIANVCGTDGIEFMLKASEGLPMQVYINLPSCVPSTPFDESGAVLNAKDLFRFYSHPRVLGLAEMMNFPGVLQEDKSVMIKISDAIKNDKTVDGHAPFLRGRDLDKYISAGITSDHECSDVEEAKEKIAKGQWIMIRQGTAAKNLLDLIDLFEKPYSNRCLLVTDDRHPADLIKEGHIDNIIRLAVKEGKPLITAVKMATLQACERFGIKGVGAIAPGYKADIAVLDGSLAVTDVYANGEKVVENKILKNFIPPIIEERLLKRVSSSFNVQNFTAQDFIIENKSDVCRVIEIVSGQLITNELQCKINWDNNGIDLKEDILKLAVIERHNNTGHKGLGFIKGIGLKKGAIASSVSHDSHNIIVIGTNEQDMAIASNVISQEGGNVVVADGKVIAQMALPIAGLMADKNGEQVAKENQSVRDAVYSLGVAKNIEPFMNMAFVSLTVIPSLKMSTQGLVDVIKQEKVSLYVDK